MVEASFLDELVNQDPVQIRGAVPQHPHYIRVLDLAQGLHLGPKLPESLEGVGGELFDGDGGDVGVVGEASLIDEAEAAVADDEVRGEILRRLEELRHGDPGETRVEGGALGDGDGVEI